MMMAVAQAAQTAISKAVPSLVSGLIVFVLSQSVFGIIWVTRQEGRITQLELETASQQKTLERIDQEGTRALALVRQIQDRGNILYEALTKRHDALEAKEHESGLQITRQSEIMRANIEGLRSDIARLQEQQTRIIQSLDANYNLINEHMRSHRR